MKSFPLLEMSDPRKGKVENFLRKIVTAKQKSKAKAEAAIQNLKRYLQTMKLPRGASRSPGSPSPSKSANVSPLSVPESVISELSPVEVNRLRSVANVLLENNSGKRANSNNERKSANSNSGKRAESNEESKSANSAEGTRRVKPRKGTEKSQKEISYAVAMKRAKELLNGRLGIKSMPPEFNPLVTIMRAEYNSSSARNAAINSYVEKVQSRREKAAIDKEEAEAAKKADAPPKRKYVRKVQAAEGPAGAGAGEGKSKSKSEKQLQLEANMKRAKEILNTRLGIKSMPPEFNPLVSILRAKHESDRARITAINKHIEVVRRARAARNSTEKAGKPKKGATRKNRS